MRPGDYYRTLHLPDDACVRARWRRWDTATARQALPLWEPAGNQSALPITRRAMMSRMPFRWIAITTLLVLILSGCGGDDDPSAEEAQAAFCDDLNELQASIDNFEQTRNDPNATIEDLENARDEVNDELQAVDDTADDVADANVDDLDSAYDALNQAVDDIGDDTTMAEAAEMVSDEVQGVRDAWQELLNFAECA
jgi:ABC-type transporter Mla subunit MlaD